jgi:sulfonate transport system substrate-binding protein
VTSRLRAIPRTVLSITFAIGLLAACSSEASTRTAAADEGPTTTAAPVSLPEAIPEGTKLVVGDQLDYLKTVLELAGEDRELPYEVEYANFVGGPPMLQAFQGGAVDTGFVASTPLIFAQAAGQDLKAVVGWASDRGLGGLLTVDPSIEGWADLLGKRVAYQRGTSAEAAVLVGLESAGLTLSDITTVDVPITQVNAALQSGSADAGLSTEPLISLFLADNPEARVAVSPDGITDRGNFLIASQRTLDDEAKSAALADYVARLVRSFEHLNENKGALAEAIFVDQYGLPVERADELVASGSGTFSFFSLPGEVLEPQQHLADLFHEAGQIPNPIDVESSFDTRFNDLVRKEAGQ